MKPQPAISSDPATGTVEKFVNLIPRIKTPIQLAGLALAIAAVIAIRSVVPGATKAQISAGAIGVVFLVFGQVFAALGSFPQKDRVKLVVSLFSIFCAFVIALVVVTSILVAKTMESVDTDSPDESHVVDLKQQIMDLRGTWESASDFGSPALSKVNERAPELAKEMLMISDSNLDQVHQILKYEYGGYAFVMAADTERDLSKKSVFSNSALDYLDHTQKLIQAIESDAISNNESREISDWIIEDQEESRVNYLRAIASCTKAKAHNNTNHSGVLEILKTIPTSFLQAYPPEKSSPLQPCLVGDS